MLPADKQCDNVRLTVLSCRSDRNRGLGHVQGPDRGRDRASSTVVLVHLLESCVHRSQSQRECSPMVVTQPTPGVGPTAIYRIPPTQLAPLYLKLEQLELVGYVLPVGSQKLTVAIF